MAGITELEFSKLCASVSAEREAIVRHNPMRTPEETLLWMLLGVLISYLSLDAAETPCFPGNTDANVFRDAILQIVARKRTEEFDALPYLAEFTDQ